MWFLLLFVLLPETGARLCSTPVEEICKPPEYHIDVIPGSERELNAVCPVFSENLECLNSYDLACAGRSRNMGLEPPVYYGRIREFLDEACDEKSELHKVLSRSLPCIKRSISLRSVTCRDERIKVMKAYEKYLKRNSVARKNAMGEENRMLRNGCLYDVFTTACVLKNIEGECGFLSYRAGVSAVKQTQFLADWCGLDVFQELSEVVPMLEISDDQKELLQEYFVVEIQ